MKISVVHRDFATDGGGERVTLSLLRALDRTGHDVVLRCLRPPRSASFCEIKGGDGAAAGPENEAGRPVHEFRCVRLRRAPPGADARWLFAGTGSDLLVVTDGGFVMERTDAPRVLLYANSDLRYETGVLSLPRPRHPRNMLRLWRTRRPFRRMIAEAGKKKVSIVPNSEHTRRAVSAAVGREVRGPVVYPPVDLARFAAAARGRPKERRAVTTGRFSPAKRHEAAVRIMRRAGGRWDAIGNARERPDLDCLEGLRNMAGPGMRFHVNAAEAELDALLGGARAYLHPRPESFGIAVVEAIAAGCVPVVPDSSAHPETVPFAELRYRTEEEAAGIVRGALDGRFDGLLPALREHAQRFSEAAFQRGMLKAIEARRP